MGRGSGGERLRQQSVTMTDHPCKGMTRAQREAFERIAVNQHPQATHKTLLALREKGLIGYTDKVVGRDALGKITVPEWFVPCLSG